MGETDRRCHRRKSGGHVGVVRTNVAAGLYEWQITTDVKPALSVSQHDRVAGSEQMQLYMRTSRFALQKRTTGNVTECKSDKHRPCSSATWGQLTLRRPSA